MKSWLDHPGVRQYLAASCWNLGAFNLGICLGWSAVTTPILQSKSSPFLGQPVSDEEISYSISLPFIAGIVFSFAWGYIANTFGRKIVAYLTGLCYIFCYVLILNTTSVNIFILSRILGGIAYCGVLFNGPMYVAEISETKNIGRLSATCIICENLGVLLIYAIGSVLNFRNINLFCITMSALYTLLLVPFPESPVFYLKYDRDTEAKLSLQWYRPNDDIYLSNEIKRLNETFVLAKKCKFKYLFTKHTLMATFIGLYLQWGIQTTGINYLITYAVVIFQHSSNILDPYVCTIITGAMLTMGSGIYFYITDIFGRKSIMFTCYSLMSLIMAILGAYFYLISHMTTVPTPILKCIPVLCLSLYFLVCSSGADIVPFTLYSEIFSSEVRNTILPFIYIWNGLVNFLVMQFVPTYLYRVVHIHGIFWLFALSTFISAMFTLLYVPETKDKSFPKIIEKLTTIACW